MINWGAHAPEENPNNTATVITPPVEVAPKRAKIRTAEARMLGIRRL